MTPSEKLYRLITQCYEATSGKAGWNRFAAELARALSANGCATIVRALAGDDEQVLWAHGEPPHRTGTWWPRSERKTVASAAERPVTTAITSFGRFLIGTLSERHGATHQLVVVRPPTAPAFAAEDVDLCAELLPHLARALRLYHTVRDSESRHQALSEIMDRLPEAIFLIDVHGRVLSCNDSARAIARQNDGLSLVDGRICLTLPNEQASLRTLIAKARALGPANAVPSGQHRDDVLTMYATRPSGRAALPVVVTPLKCGGRADRGMPAVAAVITKDVDDGASVLAPDLATTFSLTPSETRLVELIADGHGMQDAAEVLGITRNTARTHMKRIYAKTGVHSQAGLIRLLSRGSLELRLNDTAR